jgi:hypothetical protein
MARKGTITMTNGREFDRKAVYAIRVMGKLDQTWSEWFDGFNITRHGEETLLQGEVIDQAALYGLLTKINDLGLALITVERMMEAK